MIRSPGGRVRLLAALVVLPLAFAACSPSAASDDGVASLSSPDAAAASPSPELSQEQLDQMVAFAQCMREHGVDMPDPAADGSVNIKIRGQVSGSTNGTNGIDPRSDEFQAAQEACQDLMPAFGPGSDGGPSTNVESAAP